MSQNSIKLYNIKKYNISKEDINNDKYVIYNNNILNENNLIDCDEEEEILNEIENLHNEYKYLNIRINKDEKNYKFFVDIDGTNNNINQITKHLYNYFQKLTTHNGLTILKYNSDSDYLIFKQNIKYSQPDESYKAVPYHIMIDNYVFSCQEIKLICEDFIKEYPQYGNNIIDTSIYTNHWFRLPNSIKGNIGDQKYDELSIHQIKQGDFIDFIPNLLYRSDYYYF